MIQRDTIFTNVALRPDGTPWWEGHDDPAPAEASTGRAAPGRRRPAKRRRTPTAASRRRRPIAQSLSPEFDNPNGVPIDAMIFGARRQRRIPLVFEARNWQHGTFLGATLSSETTAAATGKVGVLRRDPMAMLPFCGYNMGDYFQHWLDMGAKVTRPPKIFRVNWFRTSDAGQVPVARLRRQPARAEVDSRSLRWPRRRRRDGDRRRAHARRHRSHRPERLRRRHDGTARRSIRPNGSKRSPVRKSCCKCSARTRQRR